VMGLVPDRTGLRHPSHHEAIESCWGERTSDIPSHPRRNDRPGEHRHPLRVQRS
jgi:hypothetical protein